jgi:hypothetical protein
METNAKYLKKIFGISFLIVCMAIPTYIGDIGHNISPCLFEQVIVELDVG